MFPVPDRLAPRWCCVPCGRIYDMGWLPWEKRVCLSCGQPLEKRLARRLKVGRLLKPWTWGRHVDEIDPRPLSEVSAAFPAPPPPKKDARPAAPWDVP